LIDLLLQVAAAAATAAAKTPPPLTANLLGQIRLKLISNDKGTLKFEVHNGTGWVCGVFPSVCTTAEVGDFLNEIATDDGQGLVSDPTHLNTSVVQAIGMTP